MLKPKEPTLSAISSTVISSEEIDVPSGRDEASEDIDGVDQLPLILDEPAVAAGADILVEVVPKRTRVVVDHLASEQPRKRPRNYIPLLDCPVLID